MEEVIVAGNGRRAKILYFYIKRMSFVSNDIGILEKKYDIKECQVNTKTKWRIPFYLIKQFFFILRNIVKSDVLVCFFAGYHSLIPAIFGKIFQKPLIVFVGGADAYKYPSFNYGHFNKYLLGKFTCLSMRLADMLIPVDSSLVFSESLYYDPKYAKQGFKQYCRNIKAPIEILRLEYDPDIFYRKSLTSPEKSFITAAFGIEGSSFVRKGIDLVIEVAGRLPDCQFTILGCSASDIRVPFTDNVKFLPPVAYDQLADVYSVHRYYLQLSIAEGFPSAICEAMLCGCIPIGSNVAAIPDIIGDAGFILAKRDVNLLAKLITDILERTDLDEFAEKARRRIMSNYHLGSRSVRLYEIMDSFI